MAIPSANINVAEIVIQGTNRANQTFAEVGTQLNAIGVNATQAAAKLATLGTVLIASSAGGIDRLRALYKTVGLVKDIAEKPIVANALQSIYDEAIAATAEVQSLTDVLGGVATAGAITAPGLLEGFFRGTDRAIQQQEKFEKRVEAGFRNLINVGKQFASTDILPNLGDRLTAGLGDGEFKQRLAGSINTATGIITTGLSSSAIGNALNRTIEQAVIGNWLTRKLPAGLNQAFGSSFANALGGLANSPILTSVLPKKLSRLGGNIFANLENEAAEGLTKGFTKGYAALDKGVDQFLKSSFSRNLGKYTAEGILGQFSRLIGRQQQTEEGDPVAERLKAAFSPAAAQVSARAGQAIGKNTTKALLEALVPDEADSSLLGLPRRILSIATNALERQGVQSFAGTGKKLAGAFLEGFAASDSIPSIVKDIIAEVPLPAADALGVKLQEFVDIPARDLAKSALEGISQTLPKILDALPNNAGKSYADALNKAADNVRSAVINGGKGFAVEFIKGIGIETAVKIALQSALGVAAGPAGLIAAVVANFDLIKSALVTAFEVGLKLAQSAIRTFNFLSIIAEKFQAIDSALGGILSEAGLNIARKLIFGISKGIAAGVGDAVINPIASAVGKVANSVDRAVLSAVDNIGKVPQKLQDLGNSLTAALSPLSGFNEPLEVFNIIEESFGGIANSAVEFTQKISFFTSGFQILQQAIATGPFQALIQQNIDLRAQLLETQSSLAATNKIIRDGQVIEDPTAAIQALTAPVEAAIAKIRKDSLDLVGVTSKDVIGVFNIVSGSASNIGIGLKQSAELASDFSAALGTIGLPLGQASQEISSILNAQVDQNSVLAKRLNLSNDEIRKLIEQGEITDENGNKVNALFDALRGRLEAFRAGNALAAKSFAGVTSNIQEVFDLIALKAGEPLLDPIVEQLTRFYDTLRGNQNQLTEYVAGLVSDARRVAESFVSILESVFASTGSTLAAIPQYLFAELAAASEALANSVRSAMEVFKPFFDLVAGLADFIRTNFSGGVAKVIIQIQVLVFAVGAVSKVFSVLLNLLPGVGELLFLITYRTAPLVNQFVVLTKALNAQSAGFLLLGQNLRSIPGGLDFVASKIPIFGGVIAQFIPQISGFAIALIGLQKNFPIVGSITQEFAKVLGSDLLPQFGKLASKNGLPALGGLLEGLGGQVDNLSDRTNLLALAQEKFAVVSKQVGAAVRAQLITLGIWVAVIAGAVIAINELIQRSRDAGAPLDKVAANLKTAAADIQDVWTSTRKVTNQELVPEQLPPSDWVDRIIISFRNFRDRLKDEYGFIVSAIEFGNSIFFGSLTLIGQVIETTIRVVLKILNAGLKLLNNTLESAYQGTIRNFQLIGAGIQGFIGFLRSLGEAVVEFVAPAVNLALSLFGRLSGGFSSAEKKAEKSGSNIGKIFSVLGRILQNTFAPIVGLIQPLLDKIMSVLAAGANEVKEEWDKSFVQTDFNGYTDFMDGLTTKTEESVEDIRQKLAGGEVQAEVKKFIDEFNGLFERAGESGTFFDEPIDGIIASLDRLKAGTGSIDEVKASIASLPDAIPEESRNGLLALLEKEFPNGAARSGESFANLNSALEGVNVEASNLKLKELQGTLEKNIGTFDDTLNSLEKYGQGNSESAKSIRLLKGELEEAQNRFTEFSESVELTGDPVQKLRNQFAALEGSLKRVTLETETATKEQTAALAQQLTEDLTTRTEYEARKGELTVEGYRSQLKATEEGLVKLQEAFDKLTPGEVKRAKEVQDQITTLRGQAAGLRIQILEGELEQERQILDRQAQQALNTVQETESQRQIQILELRNKGLITGDQVNEAQLQSTRRRTQEELAIEQIRLAQLQENENANQDQIVASRQRTLELTKQLLENENQLYEAHIANIQQSLNRQIQDRTIALNQQRNAGLISDQQVQQEQAALNVARLRAELQAETRNADRRRELMVELTEAERSLQEQNAALLEERLNRQAQGYANRIEEQNAALRDQLALYDALGGALEQQTRLLEAQQSLMSATDGFLQNQFNALSGLERSERKRRELAQITATLQLESLAQRQRTEERIFEIQQEQNRLALQRQQIENDIAIAQQQAAVLRGEAAVQRAGVDLSQGRISQEEFGATQLEQRANLAQLNALLQQRGLIQQQVALQPQLEAASRQQFRLQQAEQRTDALMGLYESLSRGQQQRIRDDLRNEISGNLGFESYSDLVQRGRSEVGQTVGAIDRGEQVGDRLLRELTPTMQRLLPGLAEKQVQPVQAPVDLPPDLQGALRGLTQTYEQVARATSQLPTLQVPGRNTYVEELRFNPQQAMQQLQQAQQMQRPQQQIPPEELGRRIADAFWETRSGFGEMANSTPGKSEVRVEAPINVTVDARGNQQSAAAIEQAVDARLQSVVRRAGSLATTSR